MTLSPRSVNLALEFMYSNLDCYKSNARRGCYNDEQMIYVSQMIADLEKAIAELIALWYNKHMMTTKQQAIEAIMAHDPKAFSIVQHDEKHFSASVGRCMAYYVIIEGKITGDVWYE